MHDKTQKLDPRWVGVNTVPVSENVARLIDPELFLVLGTPNTAWMNEKAKTVRGLFAEGQMASLVLELLVNQIRIGRVAERGVNVPDDEKSAYFWSIAKLAGIPFSIGHSSEGLSARIAEIIDQS